MRWPYKNSQELRMRKIMIATAAAAAIAMTASVAAPASAQSVSVGAANLNAAGTGSLTTQVRWRGRHHWHHGRWHHGRWHGYRRGWGPAVGLGIGTGLLLGGLAASAQAQSSIDWCDAHYRSYDRASQTYLGYDGYRHSCP
jgi:hypothetical protein